MSLELITLHDALQAPHALFENGRLVALFVRVGAARAYMKRLQDIDEGRKRKR